MLRTLGVALATFSDRLAIFNVTCWCNVAHVCFCFQPFLLFWTCTNRDLRGCGVPAGLGPSLTPNGVEKILACSRFSEGSSACRLRGGGKWQFLHWRVLGDSPAVTPLHGCLSSHLKWKCTPRFKRRNRRASESTSPLPLNVSMRRAPPSRSCHHPQTFFFALPSIPTLAFSLTLTHVPPAHSSSGLPQPRHFMVC